MLYSQVFHIVGNAWNILSDREKASGTLDVSYKRQMVLLINLSLLEVTSKVPAPFFSTHRGFFYAIPIAYCIPFFTRNVQPFILQRQADTLPAAKEWEKEVWREGKIPTNGKKAQMFNYKRKLLANVTTLKCEYMCSI